MGGFVARLGVGTFFVQNVDAFQRRCYSSDSSVDCKMSSYHEDDGKKDNDNRSNGGANDSSDDANGQNTESKDDHNIENSTSGTANSNIISINNSINNSTTFD